MAKQSWATDDMIAAAKAATIERCAEVRDQLLEAHFAVAHTDMIGDQERREGYVEGVTAFAAAIRALKDSPG